MDFSGEIRSREVVKMFKIRNTLHEMVQDRGFVVPEDDLRMPIQEFQERFFVHTGNGLELDYAKVNFVVTHRNDPNRSLMVYFMKDEAVGVQPIRKLCEKLATSQMYNAIIIYKKSITSSANKIIQTLASNYSIESFQEDELMVNITKHELVPKHIVMTPQEKEELLKRYRLRETQLPRILQSDPVARYFGLKRNQVVKIIRNSETAGRYVTYRLCW